MENTVKQRLIDFIKFKNLSQGKFEKEICVSNGFVNNISKSIGADKLQRILNKFPELNPEWLLTGEGEMLKIENNTTSTENKHLQQLVDALTKTVSSQELLITTLLEKVERLQRALDERELKPL